MCWLLINLNDLLQKLDSLGRRVDFTDDIHEACKAADVTALINNARNAACHLNSSNHLHEANKLSFNVARGYVPRMLVINDVVFGCDYADDAAVMFGSNIVYLRRHLERAHNAAQLIVRELAP